LDNGNLDAYRQLEEEVLEECFYAQKLSRDALSDYIEQSLDEARSFRESIPELISATQRLRRAADARPLLFATYIKTASRLLMMQKREGEMLPFTISRTFSELMKTLEDQLSKARGDRSFRQGQTAGCLEYRTDVRSQRSANHAENGLIFSLALHFRHWTAPELGEIRMPCAMPKEGRPCFPIIAKFIHATLGEVEAEPYKPKAIDDRLKKLLKNHPGVVYVAWK
jgi:hypothetical protein